MAMKMEIELVPSVAGKYYDLENHLIYKLRMLACDKVVKVVLVTYNILIAITVFSKC